MTLTIVPGALRRSMSRTAACMRKNGARRLIAMCSSNSSGVVSSRVPLDVSPAALTRQSMRPNALTTVATEPCACATSATSVDTNSASARLAQRGDELLARLAALAGDGDGGAFPCGGPGHAGTHALRPAADQHDPVVQQGDGSRRSRRGG